MSVSFRTQYLSPLVKTTKNFAHNYANFVLGVEQSEVFSDELQKAVRGVKDPLTKKYIGGNGLNNFRSNLKNAWNTSAKAVEGKSFWKTIKESFKTMPEEFKGLGQEAKFAAKSKGALKILGKRMPLIGNLIFAAMEIPNIFKAFKDGGFVTGLTETVKSTAKFGGFAAGAAIGQAIIPIPFVGAMIGGMIGGWIADKVVGKSFTDKQEEAKAAPDGMTGAGGQALKPDGMTGAAAPVQAQAQQSQYPQPQYPQYPMQNQFNPSQYMIDPSAYQSSSSNPFDMSGDFLAQAQFGTSNNNFGYKQQPQF